MREDSKLIYIGGISSFKIIFITIIFGTIYKQVKTIGEYKIKIAFQHYIGTHNITGA